MDDTRAHFDAAAGGYDLMVRKLIPHYDAMLEAVVDALPFGSDEALRVIDLGCGTGELSLRVKQEFPRARITCLDFAPNMLELARRKLAALPDIGFVAGDLTAFPAGERYDAVVSSLAVHHLTDDGKQRLFNRIAGVLGNGGAFFMADGVRGQNEFLHQVNLLRWKEFIGKSFPPDELEGVWENMHRAEDRPAPLRDQLDWLRAAGFRDVDVVWKYYKFAVFGGMR